jgi:hypothetical protein
MGKGERMATKTTKRCKCIELVNKELAKSNAEIDTHMSINFATGSATVWPYIPLKRIDSVKRTKLPTVVWTYCAICGKKLHP